jgi:hypothetical protein
MLVKIATFSFPHEAHIARALLDAMGIPSFVADEHTINAIWLFSDAMGGVRLQVPAAFAIQAQEILNGPVEIESIPELNVGHEPESAACPYCSGVLGEQYVAGRRFAFATWLILGFPFWPIKKVRKCMACGKVSKA